MSCSELSVLLYSPTSKPTVALESVSRVRQCLCINIHDCAVCVDNCVSSACVCFSQEEADTDWNLPQLVWQTVAPDKCRGYVQIVEAPLAGRLWEATPDAMKWQLHPKILRELEEPPPVEEVEEELQEQWGEPAAAGSWSWTYAAWETHQPVEQDWSARWQGTSSSSTSQWSPSDAWGRPWEWSSWGEGAYHWRTG